MAPSSLFKPLGVFVLVIALIVGIAFVVPLALGGSGGGGSDASLYDDDVPGHMQPDSVNAPSAEESGEIQLEADAEDKQILVDTRHANRFERDDLDPLVNALVRNGHTVDFTASSNGDGGFGGGSYNSTLQEYDAVLIVHPTESFSDSEVSGLKAYADGGGRVVVLGEPTQIETTGSGLLAQSTRVRSEVNDLTHEFGIHVGSEQLYNMDDESTDNYYKSIYAAPSADGELTEGVDTVDLDTSTYVVTLDDSDAETVLTAADGTKTYSTRKEGTYDIAARNGNVAVVGDSSFLTTSEVYDVDNEQFVSNLLEFLVTGDKDDDVPSSGGGDGSGMGANP